MGTGVGGVTTVFWAAATATAPTATAPTAAPIVAPAALPAAPLIAPPAVDEAPLTPLVAALEPEADTVLTCVLENVLSIEPVTALVATAPAALTRSACPAKIAKIRPATVTETLSAWQTKHTTSV